MQKGLQLWIQGLFHNLSQVLVNLGLESYRLVPPIKPLVLWYDM